MFRGVVWNLMLALIPVALAYGWTHLAAGKGKKGPLLWVLLAPVIVAWLVFLPNTCYLLTEWRHLLFDRQWEDLLDRAHMDRTAMLRTAKWALMFLGYSGVGMVLFALGIRPVERWLRSRGQRFYLWAPGLFFLISLGVYLGLIVRLNSWDLIQRPLKVWGSMHHALTNSTLLVSVIVFGVLLWAAYEAIDIWIDGMAARLPFLKKSAGSSAPRPARVRAAA
jgi:uncharacterized membrane protein